MTFDRRQIVSLLAQSLVTAPLWSRAQAEPAAGPAKDPHFFIEIFYGGGWDVSYLFDARPLEMTQASLIQNYTGTAPERWTDAQGQTAWVGPAAARLKPYFDSFSIVNGVHMATNFDGHDQNSLYSLTGNPFGGDTYLAQIAKGSSLIDYVQLGLLPTPSIRNRSKSIVLTPEKAQQLSKNLQGSGPVTPTHAVLDRYLAARFQAAGADQPSSGLFSEGVSLMRAGLAGSRDIEQRLREVQLDFSGATPIVQALQVARAYFQKGIAQVALLAQKPDIDAHSVDLAKAQPKNLSEVCDEIASVLKFLKESPATSPHNTCLLDETTVLITSEFSRSMRQRSFAIDATGTDHNALSNSVLLAGKGIRAGQILGASDFQSSEESLSPLHLKMDPHRLKCMGMPFDFGSQKSRTYGSGELDAVYRPENFLSFGSVANTIYSLFQGDPAWAWQLGRNGPKAPILSRLLS